MSQSSQPYTPTNMTSQTAAIYKANLDGNSAITTNPAGAFYVYPNNPVAMNVLVDAANYWIYNRTSGVLTQPFTSTQTVSLTAPGSNSQYAIVVIDLATGALSVQYGTASATPVFPTLTGTVQPLAAVLLTAGQTSVVLGNISDLRPMIVHP